MAKILLFPICGIVSLVILANTLSVALQNVNPNTSIWLNPLNINARIVLASEKLRKRDISQIDELKNIIHTGRKYAPIDARLISLDGIYNKSIGQPEKAQEHFSTSLAIQPTEYQALLYKFQHHYKKRQYIKALNIINIISKRWPDQKKTFLQFIPAIAITQTGFDHASKLFNTSNQLRLFLITALVKNPATIKLAVKLIQNWHGSSNRDYWNLGNYVTKSLLKSQKYNEANLAFRSFLNPREQNLYKYIYNGNFSKPFLRNYFDWVISEQIGVSHSIKQKRQNNKDQSYLEIRFLGKPIQYKNVSQYFKLSPGNYELKIDYFTKELTAPKPIKVTISCYTTKFNMVTFTFNSTGTKPDKGNLKFNVPNKKCELAQIYFHTDFIAKSWRNRYSGILGINSISLEKAVN